ncbi:transglycosylase domain-containing protein [Catonella massiliensis]|uniref:Penicillin-binding protein 1A n=1 Tax=Catonella massiliensis TaxID=2799636 RepID=A0ABS1IXC0_9FIRM|nr:transglycosylase domain-containing protein [Catonella massiliensis]MBK5896544.1 transglycosylase domain-containing protein [Catonella massiliensis]
MAKKVKKQKRQKNPVERAIGIVIKIIIALLLAIVVIGGVLIYMKYGKKLIAMESDAKKIVSKSTMETFRQNETSIVYDANGNIMSKLKGEKDVYYIKYSDIPQVAVDAITSIEDKNFFKHKGYDLKAIIRAGLAYIKNKGVITQGGSTITQQLARNIFLSFEESWQRKAREVFIAIELEKKYTKKEIMEFYLNNIYFANGYYGIQSAALGYFGKGVNSLSLSQITFLLSIPNSPTRYNPYENIEGTLARRDRILDQMVLDGKISEAEASKAKSEEIKLKAPKVEKSSYALTFALDRAVKALMKSEGFNFRYSFNSDEDRKAYNENYSEVYSSCQTRLYSGGYRIYTSIDPEKQKLLQDTVDNGLSVSSEKSKSGIYSLQGAAVTIDNSSGRVVAIVGGRSQKLKGSTLNRAYQSFRQPGSTIKPLIVYTPAFEQGYTPESMVKDEKIEGGPVNADGVFSGNMTILDALAKSKNTVAWKLFTEISPAIGIGKLLDMGFSAISDTDYYPSAALGGFTKGVNAVEMASAYAAIENGGEFREPTCIMKMTDSSGNDIVADGFYQKGTSKYIYDENACKMMITCMEAVMTKGTGVGGKLATMPCAGKTGTTNDSKDLWFVGFTKYYTTSVWVGYDIPRSLAGLSYTATPLGIWKTYMDSINNGLPLAKLDDYKITVAPTKEDNKETEEETKEEQEEEEKAKEEEEKKLEEEKKAEEEKKNTNTDTKKQDETTIDEGENPEEGTVNEDNPSNEDSDNTGSAEDNNTDNGQTEGATENSDGTAETP